MRRVIVLSALLVLLSACGSSTATLSDAQKNAPAAAAPASGGLPWNAPADPAAATAAAGLELGTHETLVHHVHAHLDVFVNGKPVVVPAGIGIDIANPAVNKGASPDGSPAYGVIHGCNAPCISPLHTHDDTGWLHTESASPVPNRLGEFFAEWGVTLNQDCVGGYCRPAASIFVVVDGKAASGDPSTVELTDHREIAVVIGTPPGSVPAGPPN